MLPRACLRPNRLLPLAVLVLFAAALGCRQPDGEERRKPEATAADPSQDTVEAVKGEAQPVELPPATADLALQEEDYASARAAFRTKLIRQGPAPQPWAKLRVPPDVAVVEYRAGDLRLKAWTDRAPAKVRGKLPAVLFLHGGWVFDEDDWVQAKPFRDAGFVVMAPILRGENGQPGYFTMFYDEVEDVLAAADHLAKLPHVDPARVSVAGHSAGGTLALLAAMASNRFRAAASISGSPDPVSFAREGQHKTVPFDPADVREVRLRSPVAYATSFKCPVRLYLGSEEIGLQASTRRLALLAKGRGLDVKMVTVPGDHLTCVPQAMRQAAEFFKRK
jgi:acetyl esterase/lipase